MLLFLFPRFRWLQSLPAELWDHLLDQLHEYLALFKLLVMICLLQQCIGKVYVSFNSLRGLNKFMGASHTTHRTGSLLKVWPYRIDRASLTWFGDKSVWPSLLLLTEKLWFCTGHLLIRLSARERFLLVLISLWYPLVRFDFGVVNY